MPDALHLVKVPLRADKMVAIARRRGLSIRDLDQGYIGHVILRELWQDRAPAPFELRGNGRHLDAWGYSRFDASILIDHATSFGDPSLLEAIGDLQAIASRAVPCFEKGRLLGYVVRACPVVRLASPRSGHKEGAEVDAFLARCFASGGAAISRQDAYRDWLMKTLGREATTGVIVTEVRIAGMSRERLIRRTHGSVRNTAHLERPDVRFEGDVIVADGERLRTYLARGVGRHRAFGFGALMLVPPRSAGAPH